MGNSKSEPYNFFKNLFKDFFSYGIVGVLSRLISLLIVPVFTRVFTPAEYGVLETILLTITILSIFGTLLLENSFMRFFFENETLSYRKTIFSTGLITLTHISILLTSIFLLFPSYFSKLLFQSSNYSLLIIVAIVRLPFKNIMAYSSVVFRVEFNLKRYAIFHISYISLTVACSIFVVLILKLGLIGLLAIQTIITIIFSFVGLYLARSYLGRIFSLSEIKRMLRYSLPMLPASFTSYAQQYVNRVFVLVLYSMHSMGIFSVAAKIAMPLMILSESLRMSWVPNAFKTWKETTSKQSFDYFLSLYIGVCCFIVISITFVSKEIVSILATREYIKAACLVGFIAMAFMFKGASRLVGVGLGIQKRTGYLSIANIISLFLGSLSMFLLAGKFDLMGIAAGTLIGEIVSFFTVFAFVKKIFPGYFRLLVPSILVLFTLFFLGIYILFPNLSFLSRSMIFVFYIISGYFFILRLVFPVILNEIKIVLKKIFNFKRLKIM